MTDRTLVIMRHSKTEQSETRADIDRELTSRGREDARAAGLWLATQGIRPGIVMCSPAKRTRMTWHEIAIAYAELASEVAEEIAGGWSPDVRYVSDLYFAGIGASLDAVREAGGEAATILMIGHNPTVSGLSVRLDDTTIRPAGGLRTSGIAIHTVTVPWTDLATARMTATHTPRA